MAAKLHNVVAQLFSRKLPRKSGKNAIQTEFFSVNGKNYLVRCGETVLVPDEVREIIDNNDEAEEKAYAYADSQKLVTPQ